MCRKQNAAAAAVQLKVNDWPNRQIFWTTAGQGCWNRKIFTGVAALHVELGIRACGGQRDCRLRPAEP